MRKGLRGKSQCCKKVTWQLDLLKWARARKPKQKFWIFFKEQLERLRDGGSMTRCQFRKSRKVRRAVQLPAQILAPTHLIGFSGASLLHPPEPLLKVFLLSP